MKFLTKQKSSRVMELKSEEVSPEALGDVRPASAPTSPREHRYRSPSFTRSGLASPRKLSEPEPNLNPEVGAAPAL